MWPLFIIGFIFEEEHTYSFLFRGKEWRCHIFINYNEKAKTNPISDMLHYDYFFLLQEAGSYNYHK